MAHWLSAAEDILMLQAALLIINGLAIARLISDQRKWRLVGCWLGLAGEPLWLWTSWTNGQWAIVILSVWYAGVFIAGIKRNRASGVTHKESDDE